MTHRIVMIVAGLSLSLVLIGRPIDVRFWTDGSLLMTDDVGNVVWRVTADQEVMS